MDLSLLMLDQTGLAGCRVMFTVRLLDCVG